MSENLNLQWESEEGLEFVMELEKMKKGKISWNLRLKLITGLGEITVHESDT